MNSKFVFFSAMTLFTLGPICDMNAASFSKPAYENKTVAKISVQMNGVESGIPYDVRHVLSKLETKEKGYFHQSTFDKDLKSLSNEFDRVEPTLVQKEGFVEITLNIWARPTIRLITFSGNTHISAKALQKELGVKNGQIFNKVQFNQALNKLKEFYIKKGFFESQLSYKATIDEKTNLASITISVNEGRSGLIENIVFEGFTTKEIALIKEMIYTSKYNLLISWLSGSGKYNEEAIEQDKSTILHLLQNSGYADAIVKIQILESNDPNKIRLKISVDRGELFHFGTINFEGNKNFENEKIKKLITIKPGDLYSPLKIQQISEAIRLLVGRKGHIESQVYGETFLDENRPIYNVNFHISEGEQFKIGLIKVFGNTQTLSHVILRESLLVPGEIFDLAKLNSTKQRLQNVGYFKNVNVYAVKTLQDKTWGKNYRDVYIEVEEAPTGHFSLFFGLNSGDGIFGGLDLTETNFNYKGFSRLFKDGISSLRGSGEYARAKVTLGSKERSYTISWLDPYFLDSIWRVGFDVFVSQSHIQAKKYGIDSYGTSVYASYPFNAFWSFGMKQRLKHAKIEVSKSASDLEKKESKGSGTVSGSSISLNFDSTDSALTPRNGFRSSLEAELAGLGGNFSFLKYSYTNTLYRELWKTAIFKSRWDFKFIQPFWRTKEAYSIPISERFFAGGESSVRGYKHLDIGKRFSDGDPMGGISSSVLSVEVLQSIFKPLDAFVFFDAGTVSLEKFKISHFKTSWGFGIRFKVAHPMAVVLGYGFPLNPDDKEQIQRFFFSMGGQF